MRSRRRIASPKGLGVHRLSLTDCDYIKDLRPAEWGPTAILRGNNPQDRMSALGLGRVKTFCQERFELGERGKRAGFGFDYARSAAISG